MPLAAMKKHPVPATSPLTPASPSQRGLEAEGRRLFHAGRPREAEGLLRRLLALDRNSATALFLLGLIEVQRGARDKAEPLFRRCLKVAPRHVGAHVNLGNLLLDRGRKTAALARYRSALEIEPTHFGWHYNIGQCLWALGRLEEAIAAYRRSLELKPDYAEAAIPLLELLWVTGQLAEAEALGLTLTHRHPALLEARCKLGKIFRRQGRLAEARTEYAAALRLEPNQPEALLGLAWILLQTKELETAEALIRRAGEGPAGPGAEALAAAAHLRARQDNFPAASALLTQAIAAGGDGVQNFLMLAFWLGAIGDRARAVAVLENGLARHGDREPSLVIALFYNQLCLCDWRQFPERLRRVLAFLRGREVPFVQPFIALLVPELTPHELRRVTQPYSLRFEPGRRHVLAPRPAAVAAGGRRRIGYLSADFHQHATAYLTAAVFEHHDPAQFEVFAYSHGPADASPMRRRLEAAFEHFVDIHRLGDLAAAQRIRDDGIDILVDLAGYTRDGRTEILAPRPAPIQVNWLGYPGTLAVDFMDYIIVDPTVAPPAEAPAYQEALAYLPHAYAPLDLQYPLASPPSRAQAGLPAEGFVFCCFNNPRKILPDFFRCWCRLLAAVPGSVLWLFASQEMVIANLRREAGQVGIDPGRILFATHLPREEHLARIPLADLVLDTLPYNAHTTTADALLMGVPVLTCLGTTFAGRVAASLLRAAGLPELVTGGLDEYEAKALSLASAPEEVAALRHQLRLARDTQPYFDPAGFTRHLEALYRRMWARHEGGLMPDLIPPA